MIRSRFGESEGELAVRKGNSPRMWFVLTTLLEKMWWKLRQFFFVSWCAMRPHRSSLAERISITE